MNENDYTRHYQNWHSDSASHIEEMKCFYKKNLLQYFPSNKEAKILDIGCGMGFLLLTLKESNYNDIQGIDLDEGQVNSCKKKGLDVSLVNDSISYLNSKTNTFDVITAFDVLEHIPPTEQIAFIKAIRNALKDTGYFLCSVPNANSFLASRNRYIDYTHHVTFTEISLDFVLYNGGFKEISIIPMEFIHFNLHPLKLIHWILFKFFRLIRRINFIAELGYQQGANVPLSFNLIGKAVK